MREALRSVSSVARAAAVLAVVLAGAAFSAPSAIVAQDLGCDGFFAQEDAQSAFETDPERWAALDRDGDGVVCEEKDSRAATERPVGLPRNAVGATVVSVIDGDTITIRFQGRTETIDLALVDTPEIGDSDSPAECYGAEAAARTKRSLKEGTAIWLEGDVADRDSSGRLLRYVWIADRLGGADFFNRTLVRQGYAVQAAPAPGAKYLTWIRRAEVRAQREGRGLWAACDAADTPR